jgi:hypothetical protein
MKLKTTTPARQPPKQKIQHGAYLSGSRTASRGRDLEHWHAAREMLCHRHGRDAKNSAGRAPEIAAPSPVA